MPRNRLLPLLLLLLLSLGDGLAEPQVHPLSEEPLLRELFSGDQPRLAQLDSCLDSVFRLKRAFEVIFSLKSVYNDFLTNRTDKLTEFEERLLIFCRDPIPAGSSDSLNSHFEHPVNAHQFAIYIARSMNPVLLELVKGHSGVKLMLRQLVANANCWLNEASVAESVQNLLTIKQFYDIPVDDFARGNFSGHLPASGGFSTQQLMEILLHLNREFDSVQVAQLAEYLRLRRKTELLELGEQPVRSLYRILGKAYYQMKQFDQATLALREYKSITAAAAAASSRDSASSQASRDRGVEADLRYIESNRRGAPEDFAAEAAKSLSSLERDFGLKVDAKPSEREGFQEYRELCRGDGSDGPLAVNASSDPLLICELWRPHNGWYAFRKELLSANPLIVRFFDVFTHERNLTDSLMQEAEKRIFEARSEDLGPEEAHMKLTKVRVHAFSKHVPPFDSNVTRSIIRRIESLTGLDASPSFTSREKYIDVSNFGHGIRNRPHQMARLPNMLYNGMAVALFSPVDDVVGGETVFPKKGLKIPIQRTDLYVWYNYLPTYSLDASVAVASCPIVFGDKWVARVTLGMARCSQDQEVAADSWVPGATMARRRSAAQSWKVLLRPKIEAPELSANGSLNGTSLNETAIHNGTGLNDTAAALGTEEVPDAEPEAAAKLASAGGNSTETADSAVEGDDAAKSAEPEVLEDALESNDGDGEKEEAKEELVG